MTISDERTIGAPPLDMAPAEWARRQELAAFYRIIDHLGWTSWINNHISARVPDSEHLLINPFGLLYSEVTASNLIKIDLDGNIIGESEHPVNRAGIVIHTAIHEARRDVQCIIHTHTIAGSAVAGLENGLDYNNINSSALLDKVSYHDYEGGTVWDEEKVRLVNDLGSNDYLILRNHGLLACGASLPETLLHIIQLELSCQIQVATMSMGQPIKQLDQATMRRTLAAADVAFADGMRTYANMYFRALEREVAAKDPSYRL